MGPIVLLRPDDNPAHAFSGEIFKAEGIYFFEVSDAQAGTAERITTRKPLLFRVLLTIPSLQWTCMLPPSRLLRR